MTNSCDLNSVSLPVRSAIAVGATDRSRVLVVEDNADGATILEKVLETVGYAVKVASNARDAIRLAESESFDLVVSDIGLPGMNGFELMAGLRDRFSLKGIALTGLGGSDETRRCQEAGFSEHIVKPVDIVQLEEAIRRVLGPRAIPIPA
jgi:CheY-like chemotaxis protein